MGAPDETNTDKSADFVTISKRQKQSRPRAKVARRQSDPTFPTLVIGDIHMRHDRVDRILEALAGRYATVVFLGDYFDQPPERRDQPVTEEQAQATVIWLKRSLTLPNRIHLLGNHDLSYLAPSRNTACSGANMHTSVATSHAFGPKELRRFRAAVRVGPWLISHAGVHPMRLEGRSAAALVAASARDLRELWKTGGHCYWSTFAPLLACGLSRGGPHWYGGVTWCDWDKEFGASPGLNQIVGHTCEPGHVRGCHRQVNEAIDSRESVAVEPGGKVYRPLGGFDSCNWCIDTALEVVAILEPNGIEFLDAGNL